jgi:chromate transporter
MAASIYLILLSIFAPLSLMSVGGGQSTLPEMHRQVVEAYRFVTEGQFVTDFAISRLAPGPGSLIVTLIGEQVAGWRGSVVATIGMFLPSSILMILIARIWMRSRAARWQIAVERGLAPVAAGLLLASVFVVARGLPGGWLSWGVTLLSTAAMLRFSRISPFWMLGLGALIFVVLGK